MLSRKQFISLVLGFTQFVFVFNAIGQSIEIIEPSSDVTVNEGDDYARIELNNPWDFTERRDIGWEENFKGSSVKVSNGNWLGTFEKTGAYLFPLFSGFKRLLHAEGLAGDRTLPGLGINHPINASKYTRLAYKLKQTNRSSYVLYWTTDKTASEYWPTGSNMIASFDGFYNANKGYHNSGWHLYQHQMNDTSEGEIYKGTWSNSVYALRIDPSLGGPAGSTTEFDWIRLVDPTSAPEMTISWNASGYPAKSFVTVYMDTNNSGFDGTPIARFASGSANSYTFSSAILPPGEYYFYTTIQADVSLATLATSSYSAKLAVTKAPSGYFTAPTQMSGQEYSSSVVKNSWDMSSASDLVNLDVSVPHILRQFTQPIFSNGVFSALADPIGTNAFGTDAQVHLNVSQTSPIDTRKYRYVSYRIMLDETQYPTIADKVFWGFVTRVVFWTNDIMIDGVRPPAHVTYEGWHTYTYDMKGSNAGEGLLEAGVPYGASNSLSHMRIDPMETTDPTWFNIDWIKLNAENTPTDNIYKISWFTQDTDSAAVSIKIYYDNNATGYNGKLITSYSNVAPGSRYHKWNTSGIAKGNYYIYMVVSDGVNTFKTYSPVHIAVGSSASTLRTKYDYDGDGKSDPVVFKPSSTGSFRILGSSSGTISYTWGKTGDTPLEGDFDGDKKSDPVILRADADGNLNWLVRRSSTGKLYQKVFGKKGDVPVIGDYNGDKRDEIAIWRQGTWIILYYSGTTSTFAWGASTDKPVPADYDRDGKTDYAVWRPSDGSWLILNSGYGTGFSATQTTISQWGSSKHTPVPADFTGDGRADFAVYNPAAKAWSVRDITNSSSKFSATWGIDGSKPVLGDYNGDRIYDLSVVRHSTKEWKHNFRNGQQLLRKWGSSGDIIPR